jgi:hypothetical protein
MCSYSECQSRSMTLQLGGVRASYTVTGHRRTGDDTAAEFRRGSVSIPFACGSAHAVSVAGEVATSGLAGGWC